MIFKGVRVSVVVCPASILKPIYKQENASVEYSELLKCKHANDFIHVYSPVNISLKIKKFHWTNSPMSVKLG